MEVEVDDKMQEQYVEILKSLRESAEQGKDFVLEQAPLVAQEIVACRAIEAIAAIIGCCIGLAIAAGFLAYILRCGAVGRMLDSNPEHLADIPVVMIGGLGSVVALVVLSISLASNSISLAKTQYAPRVVVLEEVGKMLK